MSALPALTFVGMEVDHQGQGRCQKHPDEWRQSRQQSRLQAFQRTINASNGLPVQHHQGDTVPFWAPDQKWPKGVCGQVNQRQCPDPSEIRQSSWRIRMVPVSRSGTGYVLGETGGQRGYSGRTLQKMAVGSSTANISRQCQQAPRGAGGTPVPQQSQYGHPGTAKKTRARAEEQPPLRRRCVT